MQKLKTILLYFFILLLPWQTRYIFGEIFYNQQKIQGVDFSIYLSEIILALVIILTIYDYYSEKISPCHSTISCDMVSTGQATHSFARNDKGKNAQNDKEKKFTPNDIDHSKPNIHRTKSLLLLFLILGCFTFNCLLAPNYQFVFFRLSWLIEAVCFLLVLKLNKPKIETISWLFVFSGLAQSCLAIWQFLTNQIIANKWLGIAKQNTDILGTPVILENGQRIIRAFGSFSHPNILGGFLVITILLTFYLWLSKKEKIALSLALICQTVGLYLTFSRGAFLALLFGLGILLLANTQHKKSIKIIPISFILATFFILSLSTNNLFLKRFDNVNNLNRKSNATRVEQIKNSWEIIKDSTWRGVGLGNYQMALTKKIPNQDVYFYQPAHNVFILIIAELGVLGLSFMILLFAKLFFTLRDFAKFDFTQQYFLIVFLTILFLGIFDHYLWTTYSGLLIFALFFAKTQ
ncbi:MAG: O-antigen ligase family protein [Patescibacteria group bacterium]